MKKYAIRWLTILAWYTAFALFVFCMMYLSGPQALYKNYGTPNDWAIDIVTNIIKCTITYYFLIYIIFLPIIRIGRIKTTLLKLAELAAFFIVLTAYEYFRAFMIPGGVAERQHLILGNWLFWEVLIGMVVIFVSLAMAINIELRAKAVRQQELEKGKLMAELSAIKYQINPHFLFNSLSFIYTKAVGNNPEVADAVTLLSEIMRYALNQEDDKSGFVALSAEMDHLKNVIQMNQLRYSDRLNIRYWEDVDDAELRVPPLILITLVENAFKHGDLNDPAHPLDIKLEVSKGRLWFYTQNKKKKGLKELSHGIGLANVRQRLQLMYGIRHQFVTREDDLYYAAEININL